jgi:hypothetical protein
VTIEMVVPFRYEIAVSQIESELSQDLPKTVIVGFVDNGKLRAKDLLAAVGDSLVRTGVIESFFTFSKKGSLVVSAAEVDDVLRSANVVISGVGDCGGCSSTATIDALKFLDRGIPSFVLASRPFEYVVDATDRQQSVAGLRRLFVDHPIWTREIEWFESNGERLADEIRRALFSSPGEGSPISEMSSNPVGDAFEGLRQSLKADDFDLTFTSVGRDYHFQIIAGDDACADCLVPVDVFTGIIVQTGIAAGLDMDTNSVVIEYPSMASHFIGS